jgi:tripartite-type tricarboxylate transporter receptor subunit TctC
MKKLIKKVILVLAMVALIGPCVIVGNFKAEASWAPKKRITFVVPFDAGGTADIPARIMIKYMNKYSAQPFTIVNMPGSGGKVGAKYVMKQPADGYTVVHVPTGWYMQHALGTADFSYKDFEPISLWAQSWLALVVKADSKYKTFQDLIKATKKNPGQIKMGGVTGTLPVLAELTIQKKTGAKFNIVSIDVNAKAAELLSGRIEAYVDGFGALSSYLESGNFRCLGVFSQTPLPGYPDIPLMKDIGVSSSEFLDQVFGLWAPKGTPVEALQYINNVIRQAAQDPDCIQEMKKANYAPIHTIRDQYIKILKKAQNDTNKAVKFMVKAK